MGDGLPLLLSVLSDVDGVTGDVVEVVEVDVGDVVCAAVVG